MIKWLILPALFIGIIVAIDSIIIAIDILDSIIERRDNDNPTT